MAPLLIDKDGINIIVQSREHLPPHIHACYGDDEALVNIKSGKMFRGSIPAKKLKIVQKWLAEGDTRATVEENFYELNPQLRPTEIKPAKNTERKRGK